MLFAGRGLAVLAVVLTAVLSVLVAPATAAPATRDVLYVGNNWDGTADVVQPRKFKRIARINIIPDIDERMKEIQSDPERYGYFLAIRQAVGEGHDQFVDDMFSSHNGRVLYVSRPSLADVVAINLRTRQIIWRMLHAEDPIDAHQAESRGLARRSRSDDAREGVESFLAKRAPEFPQRVSADYFDIFDS